MGPALRAGAVTAVAGTASYLAILLTSNSFAATSVEAADLRSLLVPFTLLLAGLALLFAVSSQVAAARGHRFPGAGSVRGWVLWTCGIGLTFGLIALVVRGVLMSVGDGLLADLSDPSAGANFLSGMVLGYLPLAMSEFVEGHLRGRGRFVQASTLVVCRALIIAVGFAVAVGEAGASPLTLPLFYGAGGVMTLGVGVVLAYRDATRPGRAGASDTALPMVRIVTRVGLPVFATYCVLSTAVSVQMLSIEIGLGGAERIAFGSIQMFQTLLIVCATGLATGVSAEILRRVVAYKLNSGDIGRVISRIANLVLLGEVAVLLVTLLLREKIFGALLVNVPMTDEIRVGAVLLMIAAFLTANNVLALTVLEEIGRAALSLVLSCVYFALLVAVIHGAAVWAHSFVAAGGALVALNAIGVLVVRVLLARLPARGGMTQVRDDV